MRKSSFNYLAVALAGGCFALSLQSLSTSTSLFPRLAAQSLGSRQAAPAVQNDFADFAEAFDAYDDAKNVASPLSTQIPPIADGFASSNLVRGAGRSTDALEARLSEFSPQERAQIEIYAKNNKSVVNIATISENQRSFFQQTSEGSGSGIVLNASGVVLTNFHVVEGSTKIDVTLFNGETYPAKPLGVDPNTDVALLKIDAPESSLFPIQFGDSSKLLVGQTVFAIGNPFGLERTMTQGIVSNLNRTIGSPQQFRQIKGVIQIDAAINPGNSGGVLLDSKGRMIGMNTAIASRVGESSGVGFAIPVNTIHRIASILLEKGEVVRGDAGVVQVTETEDGLIPSLIDEGGAADLAGLRGGKLVVSIHRRNGVQYQTRQIHRPEEGFDVIFGVNGAPVKTGEDFITAVEEHAPGETITLNILRRGQKIDLPVVLK
ncbi:MAG: trypsin-like peptidase domain-containing protein [Thermoguttaceae bacterium]|nr:trypsin-like peptidase domain-containing protein [Thermoguttaceae bacterium]